MTNAITFRMAQGVPGDLSRLGVGETVEQVPYGATAFPAYGLAAIISSSTAVPPSATGQPYGLLVRPFPMEDFTAQTGAPNTGPALGTSTPPTAGIAGLMTRGYMTVFCRAGTPVLGGAVYVRYGSPSGQLILGGLEASSSSGNVAVTNARWMGGADAAGNAEVFFDNP